MRGQGQRGGAKTSSAFIVAAVLLHPFSSPAPCPLPPAPRARRSATGGRGADCVLEVVGSPAALRLAFDLVRPGGTLSSVGCHTGGWVREWVDRELLAARM